MDEIYSIFKERGNKYIDNLDSLYAFLVEPFICFQETQIRSNENEEDICPLPTFFKQQEIETKNELPADLFVKL